MDYEDSFANINDTYLYYIFLVDASEAGEGRLEIQIMCNGQTIPNRLVSLGHCKYEVSFTADKTTEHEALITFNKEPIQGIFRIRGYL